MLKESIISKIKKLLALTEDRGATKDEAATAAAKAQQLLLEHNLSLDSVQTVDLEAEEILRQDQYLAAERSPYAKPYAALLNNISRYNFCRAVYLNNGKSALIGKKHNVEVVAYLFTYLSKALEKEADQQGRLYTTSRLRSFKSAFVVGAAYEIGERLKQQREQQEKTISNCTALVVREDARVAEKTKSEFPRTGNIRQTRRESFALNLGRAHGRTMPLNAGVGRGAVSGVLS